jgi:hypothetical protein
MFEKIRDKMREKIRSLEYVVTIHAEEEMANDGLTVFDVENGVLTGEILERQDIETGEWKYLIGEKQLTAKI